MRFLAAQPGDIELHGLTVMSTSFLSSKRFDDGSVVLSIEAHPARNAMQISHAIHFFIFITGSLLLFSCSGLHDYARQVGRLSSTAGIYIGQNDS
jgi:hypothetical protein